MLQFLSIYLLLSIKCFHFRTTGSISKRHLNVHRYTIQIKSYLVQWLHVLEPQCSLWSGFGVCHPLDSEEEIIYLFKNYCFQKHSGWRGGGGVGDGRAVAHQIICNLIFFIALVSAFLLQKKLPHCY